jgi:DNA-binding winged helix-turn-helix (wHTH) protein/tetratricopeptide (TPR) repeat protein
MTTIPAAIRFQGFSIPGEADVLYRSDAVVPLEPQAVRVLRYLAEHRTRVVGKQELLQTLWPDVVPTEAVLKKAVSQIRRALGDDADAGPFIQTHHRRGYRFVAPPDERSVAPAPEPVELATEPDFSRLVGRENELGVLRNEFQRVIGGEGRAVLLAGDPGLGKTRLARHFVEWAEGRGATALYARFFEYAGSRLAPFEVFLDLLRTALGGRSPYADPAFNLRLLAQLRCGVSLPVELTSTWPGEGSRQAGDAADRFRAVIPIGDCFVRLSRFRPIVLVLDDFQWADEGDRDVVGYMLRTAGTRRILLVTVARTEDVRDSSHPLSSWLERQAAERAFTSLDLSPWSEEQCREAVERLFAGPGGPPAVPPEDVRTLFEASEGNPYFLTEILRLLVSEHVAWRAPAGLGWRWRGLSDVPLPHSLVIAAKAQFGRLRGEVQELVEQASVIGDEFTAATLARLAGRPPAEVDEMLSEAVRIGVLSDRELSAAEDYRFQHALLRRVLYDGLPARRKRALHAAAAAALEAVYGEDPDRVAGAIGAHCEATQDPRRAFAWSLRAARAARRRWRWPEAVVSLERAERAAVALSQDAGEALPPETWLELLHGLGESYGSVGRLKEAQALLARTIAMADREERPALLASAMVQQAVTESSLGHYLNACQSADRASQLYRDLGDREGEALAVLQHASAEVALGRYEAAAPRVLELLKDIDPESQVGLASTATLGWALALQGRYSDAVPALEHAIAGYERLPDLRRRAVVLRRLHWVNLSQGHYETAIELAEKARDAFHRMDDRHGEARLTMGIGQARIAQGLYDEGLTLLGRASEMARSIGAGHCEAETLWLTGRALVETGRVAEALALLRRALSRVEEIGDDDDRFRILTDFARAYLASGEPAEALAATDQSKALARRLGNRDGLALALVERSRALLAAGRRPEALADAREAVPVLDDTGSGERWRGYWALGLALAGDGGDPDEATEAAISALRRATTLLSEMRAELRTSDRERLAQVTLARAGPARDLFPLLRETDRLAEARSVAADWNLGQGAW